MLKLISEKSDFAPNDFEILFIRTMISPQIIQKAKLAYVSNNLIPARCF